MTDAIQTGNHDAPGEDIPAFTTTAAEEALAGGFSPEFAFMLEDDTTTKQEQKLEQQAIQAENAFKCDKDKACQYAVFAIKKACGEVSKRTGAPIELDKEYLGLVSMAFAPVIMKYHEPVMRAIANMGDIDMDSKWPEAVAAIGVVGVGAPVIMQVKKHRNEQSAAEQAQQEDKKPKPESKPDGDKREQQPQ